MSAYDLTLRKNGIFGESKIYLTKALIGWWYICDSLYNSPIKHQSLNQLTKLYSELHFTN